jgi:hypothetical protein
MSAIDLFKLLPAVYRIRDAQIASAQTPLNEAQQAQLAALLQLQAIGTLLTKDQLAELLLLQTLAARGPLESLLMVVSEQLEAVAYDLDQLYDDQFIETCAQWVIPYIGDLIGYQSVTGIAPAVDNPRAEVAETISLRRRKGTILVMEQLARDATGWGAHAKEEFQVLADTQYVKHVRLGNLYAPNLRRWQAGLYMDTGFDGTAHKVDVRRIDSTKGNGRGQYNIQNIAVFLWSLSANSVTQAPMTAMEKGNAQCFRFSALGQDVPLFHRAISQGEQIAAAAGPANVADRLPRRVLCADMNQGVGATYYGHGASLAIYLDKALQSPYQIAVVDLAGADGAWANLAVTVPPTGPFANSQIKVLVDPELGRLALSPASVAAGLAPSATWYYGANATMGGGEYARNTTASPFAVTNSAYVVPFPDGRFAGLQDALTYAVNLLALGNAVAVEISGEPVVDALSDVAANEYPYVSASVMVTTPLKVDLPLNTTLELRAAEETVQTLLLDEALTVTGDAGSQFVMNGIVLAAQKGFKVPGKEAALLDVPLARTSGAENLLEQLTLTDCTLVPGWGFEAATGDGKPQKFAQPKRPVLQLAANAVTLTATNSIVGGIRSNPLATVALTNCIVDATDPSYTAYAAGDDTSGGAALTMNGCTVVGRVHASVLQYVSDCIFWANDDRQLGPGLVADRRQQGCVRFSFLPFRAVVPAHYECVQQKVAGVWPAFVTTRYGQPGYMKLMACTDDAIRRGADDGSEMGAYHFAMAPQRESDLQIRMQEYAPVGMEFGIVYQT